MPGFLDVLPSVLSSGILPVHQLPRVGNCSKGCDARISAFFEARGVLAHQLKAVYTSCALLINAIAYQWVKLDDDVLPLINKAMASTGRKFTITSLSGISTVHMHSSLTTDIALLAFASRTLEIPPPPNPEDNFFVYFLPEQDINLLKRRRLRLELLVCPKAEYRRVLRGGEDPCLLTGCLPELLKRGKLLPEQLPQSFEMWFRGMSVVRQEPHKKLSTVQPLAQVLNSPSLREAFLHDLQGPTPLHNFLFDAFKDGEHTGGAFLSKLFLVVTERTVPLLKRGIVTMSALLDENEEFLRLLPASTVSLVLEEKLSWDTVTACSVDFDSRTASRGGAVCSTQICRLLASGFLKQEELLTAPVDLLACLQMWNVVTAIGVSGASRDILTTDPITVHLLLVLHMHQHLLKQANEKREAENTSAPKAKKSSADFHLDHKDHPGLLFHTNSIVLLEPLPTFEAVQRLSAYEVLKLLIDKYGIKALRDIMCEAMPIYHGERNWIITLLSRHFFQGIDAGIFSFEQLVDPRVRGSLRTIVNGLPVLMEKHLTLEDLAMGGLAPFVTTQAGLRAFRIGVIDRTRLLEMDADMLEVYQRFICTMPVLDLIEAGEVEVANLIRLPEESQTIQHLKLITVPNIDLDFLKEHPTIAKVVPIAFLDALRQGAVNLEDFYRAASAEQPGLYFANHLLDNFPFEKTVTLSPRMLPEITPPLVQLMKELDVSLDVITELWSKFCGKPTRQHTQNNARLYLTQERPPCKVLQRLTLPGVRAALVDKLISVDQLFEVQQAVIDNFLSENAMTLLREGLLDRVTLVHLPDGAHNFVCSAAGLKILRARKLDIEKLQTVPPQHFDALTHDVLAEAFLEGLLQLEDLEELREPFNFISQPAVLEAVRAGVTTFAQFSALARTAGWGMTTGFAQQLFTPKRIQAMKDRIISMDDMIHFVQENSLDKLIGHVDRTIDDPFLKGVMLKDHDRSQPFMAFSSGNDAPATTTAPLPSKKQPTRGKRTRQHITKPKLSPTNEPKFSFEAAPSAEAKFTFTASPPAQAKLTTEGTAPTDVATLIGEPPVSQP